MKRVRKSRILSMFLTVCLLCGLLPADMLGGFAMVEAAEVAEAESVTYEEGIWTVSGEDSAYETRTVTWDFTTATVDTSVTLANGDSVKGIVNDSGKVQIKTTTQGLSLGDGGSIMIPLDTNTTSVTTSFVLTSKNGARYFTVGGSTVQRVCHSSSFVDYDSSVDGVLITNGTVHEFTGTYDSSYFTGSFLQVKSYAGESKIGKLILTEMRPASTGGEEDPGPEITEVKATVTISGAKDLLGDGDTVTLINMSDTSDVYDITSADTTEFTLKASATYQIVSSNTDIKATTGDGKTTIASGTEDFALSVELVSTVVHPIVTITDAANVLGETILSLTNKADETDTHVLVNGESLKLNIGAAYLLTSSGGAVVATIGGNKLLCVTADMTTVEVVVQAADVSRHTYDVWDFGAEQFINTEQVDYNNKLTEEIINGWFPGVTPGTSGVTIPRDLISYNENAEVEFRFNTGGFNTTHRYRTKNENLTRYDARSLMNIEDSNIIYNGYIYSNKGKTDAVNVQLLVKAGDIVTFVVSSNGATSNLTWRSPSGVEEVQVYNGIGSQAQVMTFFVAEDGMYTLYSATEKLVVARILRERPSQVTVQGKVMVPAGADLSEASLVFTNQVTGAETRAAIQENTYSVTLSEQYIYSINLEGANGYIVGATNEIILANEAGNTTYDIEIVEVELVEVTGSLADLTQKAAENLELTFVSDGIYVPEVKINVADSTYDVKLEKGVTYTLQEAGVQDYELETSTLKMDASGTAHIKFIKKPVYAVNVVLQGLTAAEVAMTMLTFTNIDEEGYAYTYTGVEGIALRDGQYVVTAALAGYVQQPTADVKIAGAPVAEQTIAMKSTSPMPTTAYKSNLTVGEGQDYTTVNQALEAVRNMERSEEQRVTISIQPGNYEEMLVIDVDNVTLKNAAATPSIGLTDKGVNIAEGAVRITSYYGHGYTYYSMGTDCKYDEELLAVNKENGYPSFENPGSGTTAGSYWNATVTVLGHGFQAGGIIFENSFNQYISPKAAADVIVAQGAAKEGATPRASMDVYDVTVQNKAYVERAAALAIGNNKEDIIFDNCKFVGRQDTLYGGKDTYVEFNQCAIYGGTDYIFGGMIAIFNQCDLVFNTSEDKNDVGYITAAQQTAGRGYLMYECHITSTTPGVDTASIYTSKPGYLGRPWAGNTSEVVFYNTTIDAADPYWEVADTGISKTNGKSLIVSGGWDSTLGGTSAGMQEYGTVEAATDYTASRVDWATGLTEAVLMDGTPITLEAFRRVATAKDYYEVNVKSGLVKGTVYDGGISVLQDFPYKVIAGDGVSVSGVIYTGEVVGTSNPLGEDGKGAAGRVPVQGAAIKLEAKKDGKLKVAAKLGSNKEMFFVEESRGTFEVYKNSSASSEYTLFSYDVEEGHTYYLYGGGTKPSIYSIVVDYREPENWEVIASPVLGTPIVDSALGTITVPFTAQVGSIYADALEVRMLLNGEIVDTISFAADAESGSVTFAPDASASYTFQAVLRRSGVLGKSSNQTEGVAFILPMREPVIINIENQGFGNVKFSWKEVSEAESYNVYLDGVFREKVTTPFCRFSELVSGQTYEFGVEAVHGEDVSTRATLTQTVTEEAKKTWLYGAFGSGTDTKNNGYSGSIDTNDLSLWSLAGKGKLVPASTDGLAFYYTTIDPATENFTLSADITVDNWTYSNGQEGFGLMAADSVGVDGDASTFWNNSYMASVTKVEYIWDKNSESISDAGDKYTMKLGVGSQEKIGATQENISDGTTINHFSTNMSALDTYAATHGLSAGTYNFVANYSNKDVDLGDINLQSTFHLEITRNNTGYFLSYTDAEGNVTTNKYYHGDDGDELTKLDANNIYVGFFASRYAKIKMSNVELTTIKPEEDAPAEERSITYVTPNYNIESAKIANSAEYEMVYYGNVDGVLTIQGLDGGVVDQQKVDAKTKFRQIVHLEKGDNTFTVTFDPDETYAPSKYERLSSYDTKVFKVTVTFQKHRGDVIYVSPSGTSAGTGSERKPMDIYTAVKYAVPGQKILLEGGTYSMDRPLVIERGIDGTASKNIYLMAAPGATNRPVLDFNRKTTGVTLAGDYWYLQGFDVTGSANGQKGLQVSGDHNTLDQINAYKNGNTGIQISRYLGTDQWEDWPSDNLVLNCTSYLNADAGYEDADGFAAKLTIADGNVFDGCIAAYNADDGWDLFAKVESGPIGVVEIHNSIAYKNGYVIDAQGKEINAGNGNGFKMGGSSITGPHILRNSIAFANKSKGIDTNSGPDNRVYQSTSFDNESYNVALYTTDARNTAYVAEGILSFKQSNTTAEQLKPMGSQDESKIYNESNYFYNGKVSVNTEGKTVQASWFKNLDTQAAIHGGITRNLDGTINMNGYLELTAEAPLNTGARLSGKASDVITAQEKDLVVALQEAQKILLQAIATDDETQILAAVGQMLDILDTVRGLDSITITSVDVLTELENLEHILEDLFGTKVTKEDSQSRVKCVSIFNALLSVPAKANGILRVTDVMKDAHLEAVLKAAAGNRKMNSVFFDLSLYINNKKVALDAPVKVTLSVPSGIDLSKAPLLIHIKGDGTWENLSYTVRGNQISFITSSFSTFILSSGVDTKASAEDSTDSAKVEENGETEELSTAKVTAKGSRKTGASKQSPVSNVDSTVSATTQGNEDKATEAKESKDTESSSENTDAGKAAEAAPVLATQAGTSQVWLILLAVLVLAGTAIVVGLSFFYKSKKED